MKPLELSMPHLIIMVGIPGSGKSFFAENFAETFRAPLISFDAIYKELTAISADDKLLNEPINKIMTNTVIEVAKSKRTIIFDGHSYTKTKCDDLSKLARTIGYEPLFIWVQTDFETVQRRLNKSAKLSKPMIIDEFNKIAQQFSPLDRVKKNIVVISGKHNYKSQLKIVLSYLSQPKK